MNNDAYRKELEHEVLLLPKDLVQLRLTSKTAGQVKDVSQFKKLKKKIARAKTKLAMHKKGSL